MTFDVFIKFTTALIMLCMLCLLSTRLTMVTISSQGCHTLLQITTIIVNRFRRNCQPLSQRLVVVEDAARGLVQGLPHAGGGERGVGVQLGRHHRRRVVGGHFVSLGFAFRAASVHVRLVRHRLIAENDLKLIVTSYLVEKQKKKELK